MPRRSVVDALSSRVNGKDEKGLYIVIYDFEVGSGGKIPTRFYDNLEKLDVKRLQKSVLLCSSRRSALIAALLVRHYGGEARVFRVSREIKV